jgi:F0F1-type ATP synthase assembly protein I
VDLNDKRDFYNGFGDGLARAFEYAVTPAIFGFLGWLLDRAVGTVPLFTIVFALLCVVGMFLKTWYTYDAMMRAHDAESPWGRGEPEASAERPGRGR